MTDKFEYQLESLLRKRRLEQDVALAEEVAAREVVDARRQEAALLEQTVDLTEQELREQCAQGRDLDSGRQALLQTYLAHQREQLKRKRSDVNQAARAHEHTVQNLEFVRCGVKTLEKHKEGRHTQFSIEWQRTEQKNVDELWLMRAHHDDREILYRLEE